MKKNVRILVLALAFSGLSAMGANAQTRANGTCGDNLTWEFNESTNTLTISGTGEMTNYEYDNYNYYIVNTPWYGFRESIYTLVLPDGLTSIGNYAFFDCEKLTGSLTIPNSVQTIGDGAFYDCDGFTGSLTIGNSVQTIGNYAFEGCSGFTGSLTIPNSVQTIGEGAFGDCSGFTGSLTIGNSVQTIGYAAFYKCSGFTGSLTIGNSVQTIGNAAFQNCSKFTKVINYSSTPQTINYNVLYNVPINNITLYVPDGSVGAYGAADVWEYFKNIEPLGNAVCDVVIPVFDEYGNPVEGAEVTVTTEGKAVYTATTNAEGKAFFTLPLGTYSYTATYNGTVVQSGTFEVNGDMTVVVGIKAVRQEKSSLTAWSSNGFLHISGLQYGERFGVYTVSGMEVYTGVACGDIESLRATSLPKGVYIIRSEKKSLKAVVNY